MQSSVSTVGVTVTVFYFTVSESHKEAPHLFTHSFPEYVIFVLNSHKPLVITETLAPCPGRMSTRTTDW